jgi:hypothetical protein
MDKLNQFMEKINLKINTINFKILELENKLNSLTNQVEVIKIKNKIESKSSNIYDYNQIIKNHSEVNYII